MKKITLCFIIIILTLILHAFGDYKIVKIKADQGIIFKSLKLTNLEGNIGACDLFIGSKKRLGIWLLEALKGFKYLGNFNSFEAIPNNDSSYLKKTDINSYENFQIGDAFYIRNQISNGFTIARIKNIEDEAITIQYKLK